MAKADSGAGTFAPNFTLLNARGRKYLTASERQRFYNAVAQDSRPSVQTFALTLYYTGARISEALNLRPADVDIEAREIRIRTLKRRREHWRAVPTLTTYLRELDLTHGLRAAQSNPAARKRPIWPWSRATAGRYIAALMRRAKIEGPMACAKGLRHSYGIAAVQAGIPLPTVAAMLGHANLTTTAVYTTAVGVEARELMARMWDAERSSPPN